MLIDSLLEHRGLHHLDPVRYPLVQLKLAGGTNGLCSPRWVKCLSQWLSEDWWPELSWTDNIDG